MLGDPCTDTCGWIAALISCLAFGTFGVPIKGKAANSVNIDPLVMQSYKTFMGFLTSWVVLLMGRPFSFTPWGIVSGMFWVPAGTATIYGIRNAGLAVTLGLGSSLIVLVSFVWGIFIFDEAVTSIVGACFGIVFMMIGLWGMSYYSSSEVTTTPTHAAVPIGSIDEHEENDGSMWQYTALHLHQQGVGRGNDIQEDSQNLESIMECEECDDGPSFNHGKRIQIHGTTANGNTTTSTSTISSTASCFGKRLTRRQMGLGCAVFSGVWGGSIMVPMHFSSSNTGGLGYVISFGIGASIITLLLWCIRFCYYLTLTTGGGCSSRSGYNNAFSDAWSMLPSFHLRIMWLPGFTAGAIWSIGNIASMVSVEYLGEGVGYSVTQSSLLVSGLW
eukprot:CAMPEP_0195509698 /NCGR_PEP_ID=MMETSP0794_2-20130614/2560_1 /TAXON_ID=515487 /ORGANISM="Stephanopyxis turris, Strain CCMP 815" /LENGTH=387 /DNA_ID=CAMNT_0040636979 /DNA_START=64 /DNA_END=1224 /DNA_ORIENTATION=+